MTPKYPTLATSTPGCSEVYCRAVLLVEYRPTFTQPPPYELITLLFAHGVTGPRERCTAGQHSWSVVSAVVHRSYFSSTGRRRRLHTPPHSPLLLVRQSNYALNRCFNGTQNMLKTNQRKKERRARGAGWWPPRLHADSRLARAEKGNTLGSHAVGSSGSVMRSLSLGRCALVASTLMRTRTLLKARVRVNVGAGLGLGLGLGSGSGCGSG